eukprot:SAG25_NODE_94_length_15935_cov_41.063463_10_plen_127_part_00
MQDHETSFVVVGMPCVPVQLHRCAIVVGHSVYALQLGYVRNVAMLEACGRRHGYGSTTAICNCTRCLEAGAERVRLRVIVKWHCFLTAPDGRAGGRTTHEHDAAAAAGCLRAASAQQQAAAAAACA